MKELIIPLSGSVSVGTVQKLYSKSRPPPDPLARPTLTSRLFAESSCRGALCPRGRQGRGSLPSPGGRASYQSLNSFQGQQLRAVGAS